jgi:hypothetical protein
MVACLRAFRKQFISSIFIISTSLGIILITPFAIQKVSEFLNDDSDDETEAYLYALLYSLTALTYAIAF